MVQIGKFSIRGYRGFKKTQILKFATYSKDGSKCGITYLVGENNSGKTSILEALRIGDTNNATNNTLNSNEATNNLSLKLYSSTSSPEILRKIVLSHTNSYTTKILKNSLMDEHFSFIPSRRHWNPTVDLYQSDLSSVQQNALRNLTLRYKINNSQFPQVAAILHTIREDPDQTFYNEAITLIRKIFPNFNSFNVINDGHLQVIYEANGVTHRSDMLGDGVVSIMAIAAFLIKKTDTVLVIDEPELSLHPLAQKRLAKLLYERSHTQQIVISTHSPYFIDTVCFEKGAVLNRVVKIKDKESKIYHTNKWPTYSKLLGGQGYQKPRIFDTVAKEIFFEDNILFVEGQDDRSLLETTATLNEDINIFGYGVGGKDNFKLALQLANDIGIQKAAVLIDGGMEENKVIEQLNSMKLNNYKIIQWNKHDIRDKSKIKAKPSFSDGYFNESGTLKTNRDDFDQKVIDINQYFSVTQYNQ